MLLPLLLVGLAVLVVAAGGVYLLGLQNHPSSVGAGSPLASVTAGPTANPTATPTPAPGPVDAGWVTFAPTGGGFSARFPGEPTLQSTTTTTAAGNAPTSIWMYIAGLSEAYAIGKVAYPASTLKGFAPAALLDAALQGMATNGGTIDSQGATTMNGHAGRTFLVTTPKGTMKGALYIVGSTLYMVFATYDPASVTPGVDAFLADFRLTV